MSPTAAAAAVFQHDTLLQERHDDESTTEGERTRFEKE
jgi:hypothetical protein